MTNWSVTVYDSIATAKTAYELIENTVYATITPFFEGNKQKLALISSDSKLVVACTDYAYEMAAGRATGYEIFSKMGYNPLVDKAADETL